MELDGRNLRQKLLSGHLILVIILLILMALIGTAEPRFFSASNLINLLRQSSIVGIVAFGMTMVILTSGIDLSVGSLLALSSLLAALAVKSGVPFFLAWGIALLSGAFLGALNGIIIAWLRVPPFIVTLGAMGVARGLSLILTGGAPVTGFVDIFRWLGAGRFLSIPVPVWLFILLFILFWSFLETTLWGEYIRYLGSSYTASWGAGVPVHSVICLVYSISGAAASLAGLILMGRLNSAQPTAGLGYEFGAIAAVVLGGTSFSGGKGSLGGTVLGVLVVAVLENGMNLLNVNPFYEQVVKGVVIAIALLIYGKSGRIRD